MTEPTTKSAFRRRTWINRELVDADRLNDLEARVDEGIRTIPIEVSDPIVAGIVGDQYSAFTAALKARIQAWVADGTIAGGGGGGGVFTVTEVQAGVYEFSNNVTVEDLGDGVYEIGA